MWQSPRNGAGRAFGCFETRPEVVFAASRPGPGVADVQAGFLRRREQHQVQRSITQLVAAMMVDEGSGIKEKLLSVWIDVEAPVAPVNPTKVVGPPSTVGRSTAKVFEKDGIDGLSRSARVASCDPAL
jgi:hypothetical protein